MKQQQTDPAAATLHPWRVSRPPFRAQPPGALGNWEWDLATGIIAWSDEVYRMFGFDPRQFQPTHQNFLSRVHPEDQSVFEGALEDALNGRRPYALEFRIRASDGTVRVVRSQGAVIANEAGRPVRMFGTAQDVTRRQWAEEALRTSEQRLRILFEYAPDAYVLCDTQGRFVDVNRAAEDISGYGREELIGKSLFQLDLLSPAERAKAAAHVGQLRQGQAVGPHEITFRRKDGSGRTVEIRCYPAQVDGQVLVLGIARDVTERHRAEEAVQQLSAQLLSLQDEERRRVAREIHDSTAQKLAGLMLALGGLEDAAAAPALRRLAAEAQALAGECAQELRTLSHLLHPPLLEELGLGVALDTYVTGFSKRSGIEVLLDVPAGLVGLPAAAELALFRIVQEGLGNILRHSGSRSARVHLTQFKERLVLEICDDGRGIPAERLRQVREHASACGVGIAGMQQRLKQLGGELEIDSTRAGVTVRATLPRHERAG